MSKYAQGAVIQQSFLGEVEEQNGDLFCLPKDYWA